MELRIRGYFDYNLKTFPKTIDELISLLENPKQMKEYILKNAKLGLPEKVVNLYRIKN